MSIYDPSAPLPDRLMTFVDPDDDTEDRSAIRDLMVEAATALKSRIHFTDEEMTVIACAVDKHRQYLLGLLGIANTEIHAAIMEKFRRHCARVSSDKRCPAGFFCVHDVLCPGARR